MALDPASDAGGGYRYQRLNDALLDAIRRGDTQQACWALEQGADPNGTFYARHPLGRIDSIDLLEAGMVDGHSPLFVAANADRSGIMEMLAMCGARLNARDVDILSLCLGEYPQAFKGSHLMPEHYDPTHRPAPEQTDDAIAWFYSRLHGTPRLYELVAGEVKPNNVMLIKEFGFAFDLAKHYQNAPPKAPQGQTIEHRGKGLATRTPRQLVFEHPAPRPPGTAGACTQLPSLRVPAQPQRFGRRTGRHQRSDAPDKEAKKSSTYKVKTQVGMIVA